MSFNDTESWKCFLDIGWRHVFYLCLSKSLQVTFSVKCLFGKGTFVNFTFKNACLELLFDKSLSDFCFTRQELALLDSFDIILFVMISLSMI